uniref:Uncharacterized protein n=1 Tax=uncultured delta proteobacterium HF4000_08N17 TaxID=710836 RepID=E0XVE4_9DELT|nr:hypothetical protein [uncultured delta proteobacterium HF4000_08N17]
MILCSRHAKSSLPVQKSAGWPPKVLFALSYNSKSTILQFITKKSKKKKLWDYLKLMHFVSIQYSKELNSNDYNQ